MGDPPAATAKSPHTIKSYGQAVRALGRWLADQGYSLDPEDVTTAQLREFQAHLLTPAEDGGAGMKNGTVCTRHDALKLFFSFLEAEEDLPNSMRKVQRPDEQGCGKSSLTLGQYSRRPPPQDVKHSAGSNRCRCMSFAVTF